MSTWKIFAGAAIVAFSLTACTASSDSPEASSTATIAPSASASPEASATVEAASCSLSTAQIGDDTMDVLGSYLIDTDGVTLLCDPTADAVDTFAIYTDLIPVGYRTGVIGFVAIDQEQSGGTDGAMQDVSGADDEPTGERYLALDTTGYSTELERTIVHEVGHTIFLTAASDVPTVYATDFNDTFTPGESYEDYPEDFVTEYAASQPDGSEDMAESWAMYVFGDTEYAGDADDDGELDVVEPGTVAAEKVAFFADYPELVNLREEILAAVGY
ncbi:hypothetical protein [Demequina aurantiaca]|uniref:hypothetical protein n=1 Tax=Demequina aurantiaca TaxID=676200 RepID=UPI003D34539D